MEWPDINTETYDFYTLYTTQQIWRRAAKAVIGDICKDHTKIRPIVDQFLEHLDEACSDTDTWRVEYRNVLKEFTALQASCSNEAALDMAQAGLDAVHELLQFRLDARTVVPCKDIFILTASFKKLGTCTVLGTKAPDIDFQFEITNPQNLQPMYGMEACEQINAWFNYGVLETSASVLAKTAVTNTSLSGSIARKKFVLLGCTSELGPAKSLLQIPGATVLGIARGGKRLDALLDFIRYNAPDDTTFLYPKSEELYPNGGADLLSQGPSVAQWILDHTDAERDELVLVPLASSSDGEEHVRLVVAMDLIIQRVMRSRENTSLWNYSSPTTVMVLRKWSGMFIKYVVVQLCRCGILT
jgi:hypothetical protein